MSEGPRIPRGNALQVAAELARRWDLSGLRLDHSAQCLVVGSLRRGAPEVGDIEIVAPLPARLPPRPAPEDDPLFRRINATMANPWTDERAALFAGLSGVGGGGGGGGGEEPLGRIEKGLRPGFLAASLVVTPAEGVEVPVQVYRYTEENRGWMILMRTGPTEFGQWVLGKWKKAFGIPLGDERYPACRENHLITNTGAIVPVATEEEVFRAIGVVPIAPDKRAAFMASLAERRSQRAGAWRGTR